MKRAVIIAGIGASLLATSLLAMGAQGGFGGNNGCEKQRGGMGYNMQGNRHGGKGGIMMQQLALSDKQQKEMAHLMVEKRFAMKELKGKGAQKQEFFKEGAFDKEAFMQKQQERAAKRSEIKADFMEKAAKILDKEQLEKFGTIMQKGRVGVCSRG